MRLWDVPGEVRVLGLSRVDLQDLFLFPYGSRVKRAVQKLFTSPGLAPAGREYDPALLRRISRALSEYDAALTAWNCDPEFGRPGYLPNVRGYVRLALRAAHELGAPLLRVTMDHAAVGANVDPVVDDLGVLTIDAERLGVRMALENHGHAADVDQMLGIVQGVGSSWLGICLDFGNFKPGRAEEDFERLAPHAIHAHAKSYSFDANGEETTIHYAHRLRVLKALGYEGMVSIEYEGDGDPASGILQTKALIERHWWA